MKQQFAVFDLSFFKQSAYYFRQNAFGQTVARIANTPTIKWRFTDLLNMSASYSPPLPIPKTVAAGNPLHHTINSIHN